MLRSLDLDSIRAVLPNRERMLLCHSAKVMQESRSAHALLRVGDESAGNPWIEGMICPHLYLTEALAQLAKLALTGGRRSLSGFKGMLSEITDLSLGRSPEAGDKVALEAALASAGERVSRFQVSA